MNAAALLIAAAIGFLAITTAETMRRKAWDRRRAKIFKRILERIRKDRPTEPPEGFQEPLEPRASRRVK